MPELHEMRIHGRGGQGAVLACAILAQAFIDEGKHAVAIPSFGFERRGAPVAAFLRFSDAPIRAMTNVYHPDCVVCIDPTVARTVDIFAGMKPGGSVVLTTKDKLDELKFPATDRPRRPVRRGRHRAHDLSPAGDQRHHARRLRAHHRAVEPGLAARRRCSKWISAMPG